MKDEYPPDFWKNAWRPNATVDPNAPPVQKRQILLDEDMTVVFPNSESVNIALRLFLKREARKQFVSQEPPTQSA